MALFAESGLALEGRTMFRQHSHFLSFVLAKQELPAWPGLSAAMENSASVLAYLMGFVKKVASLNAALASAPCPQFVMPGSVYSQYLLSFGLSGAVPLTRALDNATSKQGLRLFGTGCVVHAPGAVVSAGPATVVVNGGMHTKAMIAGLRALNAKLTILDAAEF